MREVLLRRWGRGVDYATTWQAMQAFTQQRSPETQDELWLLEHAPVYTRGLNAKEPAPKASIPTVDTDRGGDLTYHGPGQLIVYMLLDLPRMGLGVRHLVSGMETVVRETLGHFGVVGHARPGAPGVYVGDAKIASLGLRIRKGYSYHGLALNVAMDLGPFSPIAPCGYRGLAMTQLADCGGPKDVDAVALVLIEALVAHFQFTLKEDAYDRP